MIQIKAKKNIKNFLISTYKIIQSVNLLKIKEMEFGTKVKNSLMKMIMGFGIKNL